MKLCALVPTVAVMLAGVAWGLDGAASQGTAKPATAAPGAPPPVENELLKEFDASLFRPSAPLKAPEAPLDPETVRQWTRELGSAAQAEDSSPLAATHDAMRAAAARLAQRDAGAETQRIQQDAVDRLRALVEKCQAACKGGSCSKPSSSNQGRPSSSPKPGSRPGGRPGAGMTDSTQPDAKPPATRPADLDATTTERLWGNLPELQRDQLLQLPAESFPPAYREQIEAYFRRLSEESGESGTTPPAPMESITPPSSAPGATTTPTEPPR